MAKKPATAQRPFHRTAPKTHEKDLIDNARYLQQHPDCLIPTGCDKYFARLHKHLTAIATLHDNPDRLKKLANKKTLEAAVAGTLLLLDAEKAPVLGYLKFSTGETAMYAQRGNADKEHLIAAQHCQDPVYRLLGIATYAKKKHLNIYSWDTGYACTGRTPQPPTDFLTFLLKKLSLTAQDDTAACPHIPPSTLREKKPISTPYLRLHWHSTHLTIGICETCAKTKGNTIIAMTRYFIEPDLSADITADVISAYSAAHEENPRDKRRATQAYFSGALTDAQFISGRAKQHQTSVRQQTDRVLMAKGEAYDSPQSFIDALQPSPEERQALDYMLTRTNQSIVIPEKTAAKVFEQLWTPYGKDFIRSIVNDPHQADTLSQLHDSPTTILKMAFEWRDHQRLLQELPQYTTLPALAQFADTITRIYKTEGTQKAVRELKRRPDTPQGKSLEYAFLLAFQAEKEAKWKFTSEEINYGEFLKPSVERLLNATPTKYTNSLQQLLSASGSTETINEPTE